MSWIGNHNFPDITLFSSGKPSDRHNVTWQSEQRNLKALSKIPLTVECKFVS